MAQLRDHVSQEMKQHALRHRNNASSRRVVSRDTLILHKPDILRSSSQQMISGRKRRLHVEEFVSGGASMRVLEDDKGDFRHQDFGNATKVVVTQEMTTAALSHKKVLYSQWRCEDPPCLTCRSILLFHLALPKAASIPPFSHSTAHSTTLEDIRPSFSNLLFFS